MSVQKSRKYARRWSVERGRLAFHSGGEHVYPTARQIWSMVFQGGAQIGGVAVEESPAAALPHLNFSRFGVDLVLLVTGTMSRGLRLELAAKVDAQIVRLERLKNGAWPDQVIIGACWHPVDTEVVEASVEALRGETIDLGGSINLGQLINLRNHPALG